MKKLKTITHISMLITTPSLFVYPQNHEPHIFPQKVNWWWTQEQAIEWVRPTTYDGIMQMLEDLESGELERRYPPELLERVNEYLATIAKEGILPNEFEEKCELEEDTYDLIYGEDSAFQLTSYLANSNEYMIIPAVLNGYSGYNIVQCGKISESWKKTKKFCKKHKKAIIIGSVVVVAATVVAVAAVAASSASAAMAVAGAATGSSGSGRSESKKSESKQETLSVSANPKKASPIDTNAFPVMKAAIDEHATLFKEFLVEDKAFQQASSPKGWNEMSLGVKAKEVGSSFAHQAYDEIVDLVKVIPQLCEEVKELGSKFLPDNLTPSGNGEMGSPLENYENLVAKGHEAIDNVFSTDLAKLYSVEAKANDPMNNFAMGELPLPGNLSRVFSNTAKLIKNGKILDRAGFTKAGRGLMKHGYREGSVFPKPLGCSKQVNDRGQKVLESIVNHPERKITYKQTKNFGKIVDLHAPEIGGAFNSSP